MAREMDATRTDLREKSRELWVLAASPAIWSVHFMACYLTAAIWCAKWAPQARSEFDTVLTAIVAYTAVALLLIGLIGWRGFRRHRLRSEEAAAEPPHDADTPEDRHRFLGFATLLLSGLSAIAVVYSAFVAIFFRSCE